MRVDLPTLAGCCGSAIIVASYLANQQGWVAARDWRYPFANLLGSTLILVSLYQDWNLGAAIIEGFWAVISLYGLARAQRGRPGTLAS
jgi:hypothetical protein